MSGFEGHLTSSKILRAVPVRLVRSQLRDFKVSRLENECKGPNTCCMDTHHTEVSTPRSQKQISVTDRSLFFLVVGLSIRFFEAHRLSAP